MLQLDFEWGYLNVSFAQSDLMSQLLVCCFEGKAPVLQSFLLNADAANMWFYCVSEFSLSVLPL